MARIEVGSSATVERRGFQGLRLSQRAQEELLAYLFISPWIVGFLIFTAGSMLFSLGLSFVSTDLLNPWRFVGLQNFANLLSDSLFWTSLRVTFTYTILAVPLNTAIALVIAILLNQKVKLLGFWRTAYYMPALVSGVAVAVLWGWVLDPNYGLLNTALSGLGVPVKLQPRWLLSEFWVIPSLVLMAVWGAGSNMLLYLAGLQSIPTQIEEAARIDGAGPFAVFTRIILPLLTPTIFFNVIINMIAAFQVFTQNYVLTQGGPNNASLTLVLYLYNQGFKNFQFGYASALAWVLFIIILCFTMLVFRSSSSWVYYEGGLRK
jgi:multiple sugar transport system permease protein